MAADVPRVVMVSRKTEYTELLARHATRGQAEFFLRTREQSIEPLEEAHARFEQALAVASRAIPAAWRRARVDRDDLDRFLFEPDDLVVVLGQDGLVPNVAKYLDRHPVIGLNPMPDRYDGVLVRHAPAYLAELLAGVLHQRADIEERTMVEARLDDGQTLCALNELFIGHQTHQSARYRLLVGENAEPQSSSGVVVATGTGATGWARSIHLARRSRMKLPRPTSRRLAYFVREAFPSGVTGTTLTEGWIDARTPLRIRSEMNGGGVIFGDGIEDDRIDFAWGQIVEVAPAERRLHLVTG